MIAQAQSIKQKLRAVILLTSGVVLLLTSIAFIGYELWNAHRNSLREAQTIAEIVAANSTAALAFQDREAAAEVLTSLRNRKSVLAAALYDNRGSLFAWHPATHPATFFPAAPGPDGYRLDGGRILLTQPVAQGSVRHGAIFLQADMGPLPERLQLYAGIAVLVMGASLLVAFLLSNVLQRRISEPILALVRATRSVAEKRDYSVRTPKLSEDEIGQLTEAFNDMLAQIEARNAVQQRAEAEIRRLNVELEERVIERTAELASANQELEAFTYSVSHDLRAPLRHVDAFAQILQTEFSGQIPEEARQYLERIRSGTRNMSSLIDDLLNLARIGRQELSRQPTDLDQIVRGVIEELRRETEGREIEWRIGPLPRVQCDTGLVKQVFVNLIDNAVKYTRPRAPAIIELGQTRFEGKPVFFIRDNGVGFNQKYAEKLFGVFQRLHRQEDFEGTGVGLATVYRIIRKHGGRIWAEAELDKGATFYFTLDGEKGGTTSFARR